MTNNIADQIVDNAAPLKDGATSFGSFYPRHYVLAVFKSDTEAAAAGAALRAAGFVGDDVIVASGSDVAEHDAAVRATQGVLAKLGEKWSRLYTDDAVVADTLMEYAKQGAAFVLAYAPEDVATTRAADVLRPLNAMVLRKYDGMTTRDLE